MNAVSKPERPISEIERRILTPDQIDDLAEALLSLTREVWVLTDRQYVLERVLEGAGLDIRQAVEKYSPTEAEAAELADKRKRLIGELLRTLKTELPAGVTHSSKFG
jgi:hypothetical protein